MGLDQSIGIVPAPAEQAGRVRLFRIDLDAVGAAPPEEALSAAEEARAHALGDGQPARRYRASRHALRAILGAELGLEPAAVRLTTTPLGRPVVESAPGLHLSVARSLGVAAIALADVPVGVDLEVVRPLPWADGLAEEHCTPDELAWLAAAPTGGRERRLLECWAAKEAVTKALGVGLALPPRDVETVGPWAPSAVAGGTRLTVELARPALGADVVAAVALADADSAALAESALAHAVQDESWALRRTAP